MWLEFAGDKVTIATDRMSRKILENRIRSLTHMQQSQIIRVEWRLYYYLVGHTKIKQFKGQYIANSYN